MVSLDHPIYLSKILSSTLFLFRLVNIMYTYKKRYDLYCLHFIFFHCCGLLGEHLLPPSNNLPCTCREFFLIMKEFGMDYQAIDACPNDHIIYYGQYASENKCPQCEISRY